MAGNTKQLRDAKAAHQKWLQKNGVSREQLKARRVDVNIHPFPDYSVESHLPLSNKFDKTPGKTSIMERRFKEKPAVRAEIEKKAMRIAPAYNKGASSYISDGDDAKNIGRK